AQAAIGGEQEDGDERQCRDARPHLGADDEPSHLVPQHGEAGDDVDLLALVDEVEPAAKVVGREVGRQEQEAEAVVGHQISDREFRL
ncbi:hypothetical protein DF186_18975, partial [Enterococcus hirae]